MDRKSKILLYTFFFLFVTTVMFSYARYMIFRDFEVVASEIKEEDSLDAELEISPDVDVDANEKQRDDSSEGAMEMYPGEISQ